MKYLAYTLVILGLLVSCKSKDQKSKKVYNTPDSGIIKIFVDDCFKPIIDSELTVFHSEKPDAKIIPIYASEQIAIDNFSKDSVEAIVLGRKLNDYEISQFRKAKGYEPKPVLLAKDAIAVIVNPQNKTSKITISEIRAILEGKIKTWDKINKNISNSNIKIIFDNQKSGTAKYMQDSLGLKNGFSGNVFAVNSNLEVINYVAKDKNSIGFIGVSWISDMDDKEVQFFKKIVKPLDVAVTDFKEGFGPYQGYVATKMYPLTREIWLYNGEPNIGLATGLANFIAGDIGQRIFLKAGMVPAIAPLRVVEFNDKPIQ